jgi:hypothetical protein
MLRAAVPVRQVWGFDIAFYINIMQMRKRLFSWRKYGLKPHLEISHSQMRI